MSKRVINKHTWQLASKDQSKPIAIAEPKHRSSATGVTSGVSLRKFPKSTVQKVREICIHYVEKCSGKYDNNKVAARYVHQMAEEVISQLAGVAAQIRTARDNQPENLQELLDEWNKNFPPSLGAIGTPKVVAATLSRQSQELDDLRNELEVERTNRAQEVADIMQSMNIQMHASCEGVMSERRQLSLTQQHQNIDHENRVQNIEAQNIQNVAHLNHSFETKIQKLQDEYRGHVCKTGERIEKLEAQLRQERKIHVSEREESERIRKSDNEDCVNQIYLLKKQVLSAQGVVSSPRKGENVTDDDLQSVVSLSYEDEKNKKKTKSLKLTGTVATAVKQMKKKLECLSKTCENNTEVIHGLRLHNDSINQERDLYKRCMKNLESLNEALRQSLSIQLYNQVDNSGESGSRRIIGVSC